MPSPLLALLLATTPATASGFDPAAHQVILAAHGEGAQIYECEPGAGGALAWAFREPIATLIVDGKTVGRHFAGPRWMLADGSLVQGKVATTIPGATAADVPQLKLDVIAHEGAGALSEATLIYRVGTQGGALAGACTARGAFRSVPYSADYLFEK